MTSSDKVKGYKECTKADDDSFDAVNFSASMIYGEHEDWEAVNVYYSFSLWYNWLLLAADVGTYGSNSCFSGLLSELSTEGPGWLFWFIFHKRAKELEYIMDDDDWSKRPQLKAKKAAKTVKKLQQKDDDDSDDSDDEYEYDDGEIFFESYVERYGVALQLAREGREFVDGFACVVGALQAGEWEQTLYWNSPFINRFNEVDFGTVNWDNSNDLVYAILAFVEAWGLAAVVPGLIRQGWAEAWDYLIYTPQFLDTLYRLFIAIYF